MKAALTTVGISKTGSIIGLNFFGLKQKAVCQKIKDPSYSEKLALLKISLENDEEYVQLDVRRTKVVDDPIRLHERKFKTGAFRVNFNCESAADKGRPIKTVLYSAL